MAFVFRQERKVFVPQPNKEVGPGTYQFSHQKQSRLPKAYVPFGSMQTRLKQIKAKELTPGPGTYQIQKQNNSEKVVVSSATEDIKILEVAKPSSIFKSNTKRFGNSATQVPGPGEYYKQLYEATLQKKQVDIEEQKPKIIQHLIKINKYQSIPSIPSNTHAYGYNQNQKNQLELNQPPVQIITGQKIDKVGPGQYNITVNSNRPKGLSWQNSKTARLYQQKTNINVGPGSYQIKPTVPVFRYKQTPEFASKSLRGMQQRKGAISQKIIRNNIPMDHTQSQTTQKAPQSTNIDDDDSYQYIDDSTPGPGSYLQMSQTKKTKVNKHSHFGSSTQRFPELAKLRNPIGPGQYQKQIGIVKNQTSKTLKKNVPFGTVNSRFQQKIEPSLIPGPGSYEPRNTLQDRLIYKIQKGYRGQFGSTQQRFRDAQIQNLGPGSYTVKQPQQSTISHTAPFKSKSTKGNYFQKTTNNPPPGSYNLNYYDLSKNIIQQQQQDPDLIIKKPGFGVGTQRFKFDEKGTKDPYEDQQMIKQILSKARQEQKNKKSINNAPFNSKEPKMILKPKQVPGPGMYQVIDDKWNKRTFNILFADI